MIITKPELPPKAGYVEDEVGGVRVYRNVETGELYGQETIPPRDERLAALESAMLAMMEVQMEGTDHV